jgi:hypothetical protein
MKDLKVRMFDTQHCFSSIQLVQFTEARRKSYKISRSSMSKEPIDLISSEQNI